MGHDAFRWPAMNGSQVGSKLDTQSASHLVANHTVLYIDAFPFGGIPFQLKGRLIGFIDLILLIFRKNGAGTRTDFFIRLGHQLHPLVKNNA